MSYKEMYANNQKNVLYAETASGTFKFSKENPKIVGRFISTNDYKKNLLSKKSILYMFDTDDGEICFFLGGATDKIMKNQFIPGQVYSIEFLGKKKTARGREMNNFAVEHIITVEEKEVL